VTTEGEADGKSAHSSDGLTGASVAPLLRLNNVTVVRSVNSQTIRILDQLSLSIAQGCHTAILGPNGSGKTSLLKLLNRQFYPSVDQGQTGEVEILGRSQWHVGELRKHLGIVSGDLDRDFTLPRSGRMTALQTVLSGYDAVQLITFTNQHDQGRTARAKELLNLVGADHLAERPLMTLSTGERRRVLIARALVHRPQALVLDEPTTGLDIAASVGFMLQVRQLARSGITIILVTHHIEEIIPEVANVILLKSGRVFAQGNTATLLSDGMLSELFDIRVHVQRNAGGRHALYNAVDSEQAHNRS
jgi:iron complex transport system ATP-binding protein